MPLSRWFEGSDKKKQPRMSHGNVASIMSASLRPQGYHRKAHSFDSGSTVSAEADSPASRKRRMTAVDLKRESLDFLRTFSPLGISRTDLFAGGLNEKLDNSDDAASPTDRLRRESNSSEKLLSGPIDPKGLYSYYWLGIVSIAALYFLWCTSLRISFEEAQAASLWIALDCAFDVVFLLDVAFQMRTSYMCEDGILEEDMNKIWVHYSRTWEFVVDVLAVIVFPIDLPYWLIWKKATPAILHIPKLLKLYRMRQFTECTESRSHLPNCWRVVFLLHSLLAIIHWNACAFFLFSRWIGLGVDKWVYPAPQGDWGDFSRQYIYSFYWSALTLTTIGELPEPQTNSEYLFVTVDYLTGILMFATLVGNIGGIVLNIQKGRIKFQSKMDSIKVYMRQTDVPSPLQEKVIKWFDYLWKHGYQVDGQQILDTLPDKLKAEIGIHVHIETLKMVDFFKDCEHGVLWELVLRLQSQVYSPGEYVCRKGEVGREMYIVNHGKLEVMVEEDGCIIKEFRKGDYFGEISVLNVHKHQRRTAFVRSMGYSNLLCLSQKNLMDVLKHYPRTREILTQKGKSRLEEIAKDPLVDDTEDQTQMHKDMCERMSSLEEKLEKILQELKSKQTS